MDKTANNAILNKTIFSSSFSVFTIAKSNFKVEKENTIEPKARNNASLPKSSTLYNLESNGSPPILITWERMVPVDRIKIFFKKMLLYKKFDFGYC